MAETVGVLNVEIKGRADALDRTLRTSERKAVESGSRMERSLAQALSFGKLAVGIKAAASAAELAFAGFDFITARIEGNFGKAYEAANRFAMQLKTLPVFGDAFKLGQFIGSGGINDDQEAAKIEAQTAAGETRRLQLLKSAEEAQKRIKDLTRETALLGAGDDEARKRIQAQFKLEDATAGIAGLSPEAQEQIKKLAQQRFKLETAEKPAGLRGTASLSATNIGLGLSTRNIDTPTKRGQERTNTLLSTISNILERSKAAVAG